MKRRLVMILAILVVTGNLLACSAQSTEVEENTEVIAEETTPTPVATATPEVVEETEQEIEVAEEVVEEIEEVIPTWYMNEEGLVNEELGIIIKKDSAEWSEFGFSGSYIINTDKHSTQNFNFVCNYYEGDIDSYIAEHEGMEKRIWEDKEYAIKEPDENNMHREIAIVGNGIVLFVNLWDYNVEEIWNTRFENGIENYEEEQTTYLAYVEDDVLYCPALGVKFLGNAEDPFNSVGIKCSDEEGYIYAGINTDSNSAEKRLDEYVRDMVKSGDTEIEEPREIELGNLMFMGKGCVSEYGFASWKFVADETNQEIRIWHTEEYELDKYIALIEQLK